MENTKLSPTVVNYHWPIYQQLTITEANGS